MECPKCGASQPASSKECSACGIIFDRWQPRAPRRTTVSAPAPVEPPERSFRIPTSLVIAVLALAIIFGLIWTRHMREARAKAKPDAFLTAVNKSGSDLRSQLQDAASAVQRAKSVAAASAPAASAAKAGLPPDLTGEKVREAIEACSFFQNPVEIDLPKRFQAAMFDIYRLRYPLDAAEQQHLIEYSAPPATVAPGDYVQVNVTPYASSKVTVLDSTDAIRFSLGRRHVSIGSTTRDSDSKANVSFTWDFDNPDAAMLAPDKSDRSGGAEFRRGDAGWTATRIWQNAGAVTKTLCP